MASAVWVRAGFGFPLVVIASLVAVALPLFMMRCSSDQAPLADFWSATRKFFIVLAGALEAQCRIFAEAWRKPLINFRQ
jgi:hypothetical protein